MKKKIYHHIHNSDIIPIGDKGENQLKFIYLKLQVEDKGREFKFKLGFGDNLLPKYLEKIFL